MKIFISRTLFLKMLVLNKNGRFICETPKCSESPEMMQMVNGKYFCVFHASTHINDRMKTILPPSKKIKCQGDRCAKKKGVIITEDGKHLCRCHRNECNCECKCHVCGRHSERVDTIREISSGKKICIFCDDLDNWANDGRTIDERYVVNIIDILVIAKNKLIKYPLISNVASSPEEQLKIDEEYRKGKERKAAAELIDAKINKIRSKYNRIPIRPPLDHISNHRLKISSPTVPAKIPTKKKPPVDHAEVKPKFKHDLCKWIGCCSFDTIEFYHGHFCDDHLATMHIIRDQINLHRGDIDELLGRIAEVNFRKDVSQGHINRIFEMNKGLMNHWEIMDKLGYITR